MSWHQTFSRRVLPVLVGLIAATTLFASPTNPEFVKVTPVPDPITVRSKLIDGAKGGMVLVGRYRIEVPAGAFEGEAIITLTVPNRSVMRCELGIEPAAVNRFKVPVILHANLNGAATQSRDFATVTLNEATGSWEIVPGTVSSGLGRISTPLPHFSSYGVVVRGRAGW